jgi:hypothetical protein
MVQTKKYRTDAIVRPLPTGGFVAKCDALALEVTNASKEEVLRAAEAAIVAELILRDRRGERAHESTTTVSSGGDVYSIEVDHPLEHFTENPLTPARVLAVLEGEVANAFSRYPEIRETLIVRDLGNGGYVLRLAGQESTLQVGPHETEASLRGSLASSLGALRIKLLT